MTEPKSFIFKFGEFEICEDEFLLIHGEETQAVEPKAFRVLLFLLRNPGRLVKKDEILRAVWDGYSVSDNSLTRSIATLRRVLGDNARESRYIATVHTVGYRFVCPVKTLGEAPAQTPVSAVPAKEQTLKKAWMAGAAVAAMLVVESLSVSRPMKTPAPKPNHSNWSVERILGLAPGRPLNRRNSLVMTECLQ